MKDFKGLLGLENTFDTSLFSYTCDKHPLKKIKMRYIIIGKFFKIEYS